ncbi:MAG: hypothetical protein IT233_00860 [Bacteroidia bacterium]|nr:hypothetical protein [Bacteroidia bacterium]
MRINALILSLLISCAVYPGGDLHTGGGRSAAIGGAGVALSDLWSSEHNQGALGLLTKGGFGIRYTNYFLLKETATYGFCGVLPVKQGVFALNISRIGYTLYGELTGGLSYAKSFGKKFSAGMRLNYLQITQGENYGIRHQVTGEVGVLAILNEHFIFGAHLANPTRASLHTWQNEKIPSVLSVGLTYRMSDKALATAEVEKNSYHPADVRFGLEYKPMKEIALRAGFSTYPYHVTFGTGIHLSSFSVDAGGAWHPVLGFTPHLSMQYHFR